MRIAFISLMDGYPWGGSEDLWCGAAGQLARGGHEVLASVKDWGADEAPELTSLENAGVEILRRRAPSPSSPARRVLRRIRRSWKADHLPHPFADVADRRPDFVVFSLGGGIPRREPFAPFIASKVPLGIVIQAAAPDWWPDDRQRMEAVGVTRAAKMLFFVSAANRELLTRQLADPLSRSEIVRNPFRVPYDKPAEWPNHSGSTRLAFVGRLQPAAKGCDLLFDVLAREKWKARDLVLNLYGTGPCASGVRELAALFQLSKVAFHGQVSAIESVWRENNVLVLPSRYEGLPLVVVEAMLQGRPVIVTPAGGELVEDNVTGFVAASTTADALDEAMERAWNRREDWRAIGERAASAIRRLVPPHPERDFANRVLQLAISRQL